MRKQIAIMAALAAIVCSPAYAQTKDSLSPMRANLRCLLQGVSYESTVGSNGRLINTAGSVDSLLCAYSGGAQKSVPLVSGDIENGMLKTKDVGNIKIQFGNSLNGNSATMYMRSSDQDKLVAFLGK